jgi:hypothetical protein
MRGGSKHGAILLWCATGAALLAIGASTLSLFYTFGVVRTVAGPTASDRPVHTMIAMQWGGLAWNTSATRITGKDAAIGTHWRCYPLQRRELWNFISVSPGDGFLPAWLLVSPPLALTLAMWASYFLRRLRGRPHQCACGYDRRGLAADAKCPECGAVPGSV